MHRGLVMNYSLGASFGTSGPKFFGLSAFTASLNAWAFSRSGQLSSTGTYRYTDDQNADNKFIRYETRYDFSSAVKALTFSLGMSKHLRFLEPV